METDKVLNKIKKLKPSQDNIKSVNNNKGLYKIVSNMYHKNYNLKIDKKTNYIIQ